MRVEKSVDTHVHEALRNCAVDLVANEMGHVDRVLVELYAMLSVVRWDQLEDVWLELKHGTLEKHERLGSNRTLVETKHCLFRVFTHVAAKSHGHVHHKSLVLFWNQCQSTTLTHGRGVEHVPSAVSGLMRVAWILEKADRKVMFWRFSTKLSGVVCTDADFDASAPASVRKDVK